MACTQYIKCARGVKKEQKEKYTRSHWHCVYTGHKYWFVHLNVGMWIKSLLQFFCLWPFLLLLLLDLDSCHCKSRTHIIIAFCFNEILSLDILFSHSLSLSVWAEWASSFRLFFFMTLMLLACSVNKFDNMLQLNPTQNIFYLCKLRNCIHKAKIT